MSNTKVIIAAIKKTADELGVHPSEVTKTVLMRQVEELPAEHPDKFTDWDIRKRGGLSGIIRAHFPVVTKDLVTIREQKEVGSYITSLEKKLSEKDLFESKIIESLGKLVVPKSITPYKPSTATVKEPRHVVAMLNDTHYGLMVNSDEVGGVNSFAWPEACRRTALFVKQAIEYKMNKRDEVEEFHLILNGDMLQGVIHDLTARTAELLVLQMNGALHILTYVIEQLASSYKKVSVYGVGGNHEDAIHRREGGRVLSHKYDNYSNTLYFALSAIFKDVKNVSFTFPKSLYGSVALPAGRLLYTHGDTMFSASLGNPGNSLNTKGLSDAINRFNSGEVERGNKRFDLLLFGHVHTHTFFTTFDGVKVLIAPSLSGLDAYAASLAINHNQVGQIIFESTENHLIGDMRLMDLAEADKDASLDAIIPTYQNALAWSA